jgi:hypothetical protein
MFICSNLSGQNGKFYYIIDKDTINIKANELQLFLEMTDGELIEFNKADELLYPKNIIVDSINSIVVSFLNKKHSFFNYKEKIKYSNLPLSILKIQRPNYRDLFTEKRNLYFTIDNYPFENNDRLLCANSNLENSNLSLSKLIIIELYYQSIEITVVN